MKTPHASRRFLADRIRRMEAILRRRQDTPEWDRNQGLLDEARYQLARLAGGAW